MRPSAVGATHDFTNKQLSHRECFPTRNKCQGPTSVGPKVLHNKLPRAAGPRAAKRSAKNEQTIRVVLASAQPIRVMVALRQLRSTFIEVA